MDVQRSKSPMGHVAWDWSAESGTKFQLVWTPGASALVFGVLPSGSTEWRTATLSNENYAVPTDAKLPDVQAIVKSFIQP
jgi:hypothetical protein